jgi:hypothetical protein
MKKEETYNNEGCGTLAGVLDCFGRPSLAMTSAWGMTDRRLFASVLDCFVPRNDERARDDERVFAGVLDCFVPRNDERARDDERVFAGVLDCFVPRNDERARDDKRVFADVLDCFGRASFAMTRAWRMTGERVFAGVLDCFVPRNDERARDDERLFNCQLIQSCLSSNPVNYLRCSPLRFKSESDKKENKQNQNKLK